MKRLNVKKLALITMMGTLGNILFLFSQYMFNLGQVTLDLSHLGTFIVAMYGGAIPGLVTGLIVGFGPGYYYGYGGHLGLLGVIGLPIGKALTGFTVGLLAEIVLPKMKKWKSIITVLLIMLGYIPECLFTILFFKILVPVFLPFVAQILATFLIPILIKAWLEIILMSILMGALVGNKGFSDFVRQNFT